MQSMQINRTLIKVTEKKDIRLKKWKERGGESKKYRKILRKNDRKRRDVKKESAGQKEKMTERKNSKKDDC